MQNKYLTKKLRIGYISSRDPNDRKAWSGTMYHMKVALELYCGEVIVLGPKSSRVKLLAYYIDKVTKLFFGKNFNLEKSRWVSMSYRAFFKKKIKNQNLDIVFAPNPIEIAYLNVDIPIIYSKDGTSILMRKNETELKPRYFEWGYNEWDGVVKRAFYNSSLIIMSSAWAAKSTINDYSIDVSKVNVMPYGANILNVPARTEKKLVNGCDLLFVGVNWKNKGGDIAYSAMRSLNDMGIPSRLTICGCLPPENVIQDHRVTLFNFLDKNSPDDLSRLKELYRTSHFLIFPTRAECYGIVVCEASAFGTPTIATDTGGVSGVVEEGVNGFLLPYAAGGKEYADKMYDLFKNEHKYFELCKSSRILYEEKLNWHVWGQSVAKKIENLISP